MPLTFCYKNKKFFLDNVLTKHIKQPLFHTWNKAFKIRNKFPILLLILLFLCFKSNDIVPIKILFLGQPFTDQPSHLFCEKPQSLNLKGFPNLSQTREKILSQCKKRTHIYLYMNKWSINGFNHPYPTVQPALSEYRLYIEVFALLLWIKIEFKS